MLAVKESYRNTGLGRRIKLFQREDAIAHGYELMEWTFDPLEIKNAYLNLERLGPSRAATTSTSTALRLRRCRDFFPPIAWSRSGG